MIRQLSTAALGVLFVNGNGIDRLDTIATRCCVVVYSKHLCCPLVLEGRGIAWPCRLGLLGPSLDLDRRRISGQYTDGMKARNGQWWEQAARAGAAEIPYTNNAANWCLCHACLLCWTRARKPSQPYRGSAWQTSGRYRMEYQEVARSGSRRGVRCWRFTNQPKRKQARRVFRCSDMRHAVRAMLLSARHNASRSMIPTVSALLPGTVTEGLQGGRAS